MVAITESTLDIFIPSRIAIMSGAFPLEWSRWTSLSMGVGVKVVFMWGRVRQPWDASVHVTTASFWAARAVLLEQWSRRHSEFLFQRHRRTRTHSLRRLLQDPLENLAHSLIQKATTIPEEDLLLPGPFLTILSPHVLGLGPNKVRQHLTFKAVQETGSPFLNPSAEVLKLVTAVDIDGRKGPLTTTRVLNHQTLLINAEYLDPCVCLQTIR
jgi:hypothetical protein